MTELKNYKHVSPGKFNNINCPYALVNGIVFHSISDAEKYCAREDLDPNTAIQSDDPTVLNMCKMIAKTSLPLLRELRDQQNIKLEKVREDLHKKVEARDKAEKTKELGWQVYQDWVLEAIGENDGVYRGLEIINSYISTLEAILRYYI